MTDVYVLSPHLDDAVLSLGQTIPPLLTTGPVKVVTVFAGVPDVGVLTDYDDAVGFTSSFEAMTARREEDSAAMAVLGVSYEHWTFFDRQYETMREERWMVDMIGELFAGRDMVFAPLGIGHPDHRYLSDVALKACPLKISTDIVAVFLYEELPYRVLWPEQVFARLDKLRADGWHVGPAPVPLIQGNLDLKRLAIDRYVSQFPNGADDPCLLVPERVWAIWKDPDE